MGKKLVVIICLLLVSTFFSYGQNGSLISRTEIDISKTELWDIISWNDTLLPQYEYAEQLDFSQIVYSSDSLKIDGFLITPKTKGNYPVVIFNRGGNICNQYTYYIYSCQRICLYKIFLIVDCVHKALFSTYLQSYQHCRYHVF